LEASYSDGLHCNRTGAPWHYGKTDHWKEDYPHCAGDAQSPIDIRTSTVKTSSDLKGLQFTCDNGNGKVSGDLSNNGHAPTLKINKTVKTGTLTGGPLGRSLYELEQLHFHFGCKNDRGSEHTVNGKRASGELHLVTYNTKYSNFDAAVSRGDGLAVIGVFIQKKKAGSLGSLRHALNTIKKTGQHTPVYGLSLYNLVPQLKDLSGTSFYSYKGSLTTPPCYQSVNWIVLKDPIPAGKRELNALRRLHNQEEHLMCDNFRPTQPLNGRKVSKYSG